MSGFSSHSSGVFVISVTPFSNDGSLDLESTDRLVDFYLSTGVSGITVLGMMGEAPKLSSIESQMFVKRVCQRVAGKVPVIVGVSSPGFAAMKELTEAVMAHGAAGVMVAPTTGLRTDQQISDYFEMAGKTLGDVPFVLQDFPLATGVEITPATVRRIADLVPTCWMLKHEDWPGLNKITALREAEAKGGRRISILTGNGGVFLPEELARGADGAMTGFGFPEMMVRVCELMGSGQSEKATDLFNAYLPLVRYEQQPKVGLAVRKFVFHKRGILKSMFIRKPGYNLTRLEIAEIEKLIARQTARLTEIEKT